MDRISLSLVAICLTVFILVGRQEARDHSGARVRQETSDNTPPCRSGTIFFRQLGEADVLWARNLADGETCLLPYGVTGEPSHHLHAGRRWFLTTRSDSARPRTGRSSRFELFVVSDRGQAVQLTHGGEFEPAPLTPRWPLHDADRTVSWIGRRWRDGKIVEGGVYTAQLAYDAAGKPAGLVAPPGRPAVTLELVTSLDLDWTPDPVPDIYSYDWSPDGRAIVYESLHHQLFIHEPTRGVTRSLGDFRAGDPIWSPRGDRIAFKMIEPTRCIATLRPDGSDLRSLLTSGDDGFLFGGFIYAPNGENTAYAQIPRASLSDPFSRVEIGVYLAKADGSRSYHATTDLREQVVPTAWRENE